MQRNQVNIRIDKEFIEKMRELAKRQRRPMSDINREALELYFAEHVVPIDIDAIYKPKNKESE